MRNYWTFSYEDDLLLAICEKCDTRNKFIWTDYDGYILPKECRKCDWKPTEFTPQDEGD